MANIDKLMSQYKELAERIEIEKEKVYTDFGKERCARGRWKYK